jgi:transposase
MANQRKPMFQIKCILQLRVEGKGKRMIARLLGISRTTLQSYLTLFENHFTDLSPLLEWSDEALHRFIQLPAASDAPHAALYARFTTYEKELSRTGVSRHTLWMEYRQDFPQGLRYSRFRKWQAWQHVVMHLEHKAGDKLFVDFAGDKLHLVDQVTGERITVELFVATLPCSQLTFALAVASQKKADFILGLQKALDYIGGVPQAIVPDNLKEP